MVKTSRMHYRLKTLLTFMLLVAAGAAVYGNRLRAAMRETVALQTIAEKGGWATCGIEGTSIGFGLPPWKSGGFLCGTGLHAVYEPTTEKIVFSDDDLHVLEDIRRLRHVNFAGAIVSSNAQNQFAKQHVRCSVKP
jgi:hypothetical protein